MNLSFHRIKIVFWFLKRPSLYKQFFRELFRFIKREKHPTLCSSPEALEWCEQKAVLEPQAIKKINSSWKYFDFNQEFPDLVDLGFGIIKGFEFNWGGQGNISLNFSIAYQLKANRIIETGVAYGWSSLSLLKSLDLVEMGSLISVDMPYWGTLYEDKIGCVIPKSLKDRWSLIRLPDRDALPKVLRESDPFDMCHYDSDKSYEGKIWALPKLWQGLRVGGILICDDINDNLAFRDFCVDHNIEPVIAQTYDSQVVKYVGIALKVHD